MTKEIIGKLSIVMGDVGELNIFVELPEDYFNIQKRDEYWLPKYNGKVYHWDEYIFQLITNMCGEILEGKTITGPRWESEEIEFIHVSTQNEKGCTNEYIFLYLSYNLPWEIEIVEGKDWDN